jgi:hypothetical protein
MESSSLEARRQFLKFLAASPYVAALGGVAAFFDHAVSAQEAQEAASVITDPAQALNVFDFEEAAHHKVRPGHWAYMASGVDDDGTLRANREAFKHIELRPGASTTPPRSTRTSTCSAPFTTARSSPAPQAARNRSPPRAKSLWQ